MLRFIKSKYFILLLITLIVLIFIGVSSNPNSKINWLGNVVNIPISPAQKIFSFSGQKIDDAFTFFKDIKAIKKENEDLRSRIDQLENENRELSGYRDENKELRQVLNLKDKFNDYEMIGSNIIAKDPGNWFNIFKIDRGSSDGIANDFPVISSKGLVGRVSSISPFSSKVVTVIDPASTVSARLTKTGDAGLVKGDLLLKDQGLCRMEYIDPDVDVAYGDTVETSGLGGIYPKGIIIGKVEVVKQVSGELSRYAIIRPTVDFKRLNEVFVLKAKNQNAETGSGPK